jgi:general stress protein 26
MTQEIEKAQQLLGTFKSGVLVSRGVHNGLHARPMMLAEVTDVRRVSFVTALDSAKVHEIRAHADVAVTFQDGALFMALAGVAEIVSERAELEKVWRKENNLWFDGPTDPNAVLIHVHVHSLEYWDERGINGVKFLLHAAKAAMTGQEPKTTPREHGKVHHVPS